MITNEYVSSPYDTKNIRLLVFRNGVRVGQFNVDSEDTMRLREHTWTIRRNGYGVCSKCSVLLHRFVMKASAGDVVDHVNRQPSDNMKANLRLGTHAQNMRNRAPNANRVLPVDIPIAGVDMTSSGRWRAMKFDNGVKRVLGVYDHLYDACLARARWELENRGEWTPIHRRWIYRLPMEFKASWLPEIFGPNPFSYWRSPLHLAFFHDKFAVGKEKDVNLKLNRYRGDYTHWIAVEKKKAANNV